MYRVEVAVIRPDFHYYKFRSMYSSVVHWDAAAYYVGAKKFYRCHVIIRLTFKGRVICTDHVNWPVDFDENDLPPLREAA